MNKKKVYIVVSIDTECDKDKNWCIPSPMSFKNIEIQKTLLSPILEKHNIVPTFLLSPEVLKHDHSIEILSSVPNAAFGTHLHIEFIEPDSDMAANRAKGIQALVSRELEFAKLQELTNLFKRKFNKHPGSFRSGRFGSSQHTTQLLIKLGYKVDSSLTPFKTHYFDNDFKINNWGVRLEPFFVDKEKTLLEVPLSLINKDYENLPRFLLRRIERNTTLIKRVLRKLGFISKTRWLRPYRETKEGLIEVSEHIIQHHFKKNDFVILNIMFHSNELIPGGSPYCKTSKEVYDFIDSLDGLFLHLNKNHEVCSIGLEDVYNIYYLK